MNKVLPFEVHASDYDQWFERYPNVFQAELRAINEHLAKLPENIQGIEVGLGTGRFSAALGIKEGIEPAKEMAKIAAKRGIEIMIGTAENLPYRDFHYDFVLLVTICYLKNVPLAFREAYRVLKNGASIIVGVLDKNMPIVKSYEEKRKSSDFYRDATFYEMPTVNRYLKEAGFKHLEYAQSLFGNLDDIDASEAPREGYGEGSFVVIRAVK